MNSIYDLLASCKFITIRAVLGKGHVIGKYLIIENIANTKYFLCCCLISNKCSLGDDTHYVLIQTISHFIGRCFCIRSTNIVMV
ncbi:hypothetical protein AO056_00212 [Aeromonas hydrophila]|nr:hypothetical protein AO056_00212 [Aeromonas hydrophila]